MTFAFVKRRSALGQGNKRTMAERNVRPFEQYSAQEAPEPVRYGDTPARPSRMPIVTFLAAAAYHAVMKDEFQIALWAPDPHAAVLPGQQLTWRERGNVHKPAAEAWGSMVVVNPEDPGYDYLK